MRKQIFSLMAMVVMMAAMMASCQHADEDFAGVSGGAAVQGSQEQQTVSFAVKGDFQVPVFNDINKRSGDAITMERTGQGNGTMSTELNSIMGTRGTLEADGRAMTDLWVLDYMGGELKQQIHQSQGDENFGAPTLTMDLGEHHLYFVVSRGTTPTLNTTLHKIEWEKANDTFWRDYALTVTQSTGAQDVTLARVSTVLSIVVDDQIPTGIASITLTPQNWYYGIDYMSGQPTGARAAYERVAPLTSAYYGTIGETSVTIYGFSGSEEWNTNVSVVGKAQNGSTLGSVTITAAPFRQNRKTIYNGRLFSGNSGFALTLSSDWDDDYNAQW